MATAQRMLGEWHRAKYPPETTPLMNLGNKLGEEAGEVNKAIDRLFYARDRYVAKLETANLSEECGDVLNVIAAICERHGWDMQTVFELAVAKVVRRDA